MTQVIRTSDVEIICDKIAECDLGEGETSAECVEEFESDIDNGDADEAVIAECADCLDGQTCEDVIATCANLCGRES